MAGSNQCLGALLPPSVTKWEWKQMNIIFEAVNYLHNIVMHALLTQYQYFSFKYQGYHQ